MPSWFSRFFVRRPPPELPLKGRRPVARVKSYSAMSGYVYEYTYLGYRDEAAVRVHVFQVSPDRKSWRPLEVTIPDCSLAEWEQTHERTLNEAERYAVAKLALFAAFDEHTGPQALMAQPVVVDSAQVAGLLDSIDL